MQKKHYKIILNIDIKLPPGGTLKLPLIKQSLRSQPALIIAS
jgi:uncharacterized lipoprotein YbaY